MPSTETWGKLGKLLNSWGVCNFFISKPGCAIPHSLTQKGHSLEQLLLSFWAMQPLAPPKLSFLMLSSSVKWHRRCCGSNKYLNFFPLAVFKTVLPNAWSQIHREGHLSQETPTSNHHQPTRKGSFPAFTPPLSLLRSLSGFSISKELAWIRRHW